MKRTFGFVAGPSSAAREQGAPDLSTSEGTIAHSLAHGELETLQAVAERGSQPSALKQSVEVVEANGVRVVVRTADIERERNRPMTRQQGAAYMANKRFLQDTNPNHQPPSHEPVKRIDAIKRLASKRAKP
jgi:hypothetical protein